MRQWFRRFFYRGRENVRSEWNLVCAALNIKKVATRVREAGGWAAIAASAAGTATRRTFSGQLKAQLDLLREWVRAIAAYSAPSPQPV
ncbi:MAG: hypothetical protein HY554_19080 [Elusimicrobia bacterium]|nr:hypothetical protein [Elusimicrobiota bacterium]